MTNWTTIDQLKNILINCLKYNIEKEKIKNNFSKSEYLIEQLEQHIDQAIPYNEDQFKIIDYYGYWNINENDTTLAQLFDQALEKLKEEVWYELEKTLV